MGLHLRRVGGGWVSAVLELLHANASQVRQSKPKSIQNEDCQSKKTVLITGANRGIGLEHTRLFAVRGIHVFATARSPDTAYDLAKLADIHPGSTQDKSQFLPMTQPNLMQAPR